MHLVVVALVHARAAVGVALDLVKEGLAVNVAGGWEQRHRALRRLGHICPCNEDSIQTGERKLLHKISRSSCGITHQH